MCVVWPPTPITGTSATTKSIVFGPRTEAHSAVRTGVLLAVRQYLVHGDLPAFRRALRAARYEDLYGAVVSDLALLDDGAITLAEFRQRLVDLL